MTGVSETDEQSPSRTTLRGWLFVAVFIGLIAAGFWGHNSHNRPLEIIGFVPILALSVFAVVWSRVKAARDPAFAARLAQAREKRGNGLVYDKGRVYRTFVSVTIALTALALINLAGEGWPSLYSLPQKQQITMLVIFGLAVFILVRTIMQAGQRRDPT